MKENKTRITFTKKDILTISMVIISSFIYACGIAVFVRSGNLFPAGFTGIARLLSSVLKDFLHINVPFSVIYFSLNVIATAFVYKKVGKKFLLFSVLWFSLASILTSIIQLPMITEDILLIAIFGGVVNGLAIGIALRFDASSGGTDFIAIDLASRFKRETWTDILLLDVIVLLFTGYLYGWNTALYSMIFQYASTEMVRVISQRYKLARLEIVTNYGDEVCEAIFSVMEHGITRQQCYGAYSGKKHEMLTMTVNENQVKLLEKVVFETDPNAFITISAIKRVVGNFKQAPLE